MRVMRPRHIGQIGGRWRAHLVAHGKQIPPWPHSSSTASRGPSKQIQQSASEASGRSSSGASASPTDGSTAISVALHAAAPHAAARMAALMPRSVLLGRASAASAAGAGSEAAAGGGAAWRGGARGSSSGDGMEARPVVRVETTGTLLWTTELRRYAVPEFGDASM